ncbi:MAG: exosortase C-terminal domain/associated protein EpsI [Candidatus Geothermincolia bacterium]
MNGVWPFILVAGVFSGTLADIVRGWFTNEASFGSVIFLVSIYMIWSKRDELSTTPVQSEYGGGMLLSALGCIGLIVGQHGNMLALREVAFVLTVAGAVWLTFGSAMLRLVLAPLLLLVFMFPFVGDTVMMLSGYLQIISAVIASGVLKLWGFSLLREKTVIVMPHLTMEVVKACAGVNHILALSVISIPMGYFTLKTRIRKILLFLSALVIGIVANGMRIAMIGIWSFYHPGGAVHGPMDLMWTSVIFFAGTAILAFQAHLMREEGAGRARSPLAPVLSQVQDRIWSRPMAVLFTVILVATGGLTYYVSPRALVLPRSLSTVPLQIGAWSGTDVARLGVSFDDAAPDAVLKRVYRDPVGNQVKLYIGHYASQKPGHEIVNDSYGSFYKGYTTMEIHLGRSRPLKIGRAEDRTDGDLLTRAFFWYDVQGRNLIKRSAVKLASAVDVVLHQRNDATIVIVLEEKHVTQDGTITDYRWLEEFAQAVETTLAASARD